MTDLFTPTETVVDPTKNYLEELVGEGKKFKTVEDLARSKIEADTFIERLKTETAGMRQELSTRVSLEQFMEKINSKSQDQASPPPNETNNQQSSNGESTALTADKIEEIIEQRIQNRESQRVQTQNLEVVQQELQKAFGNDYVSHLKQRALSLGVPEAFLSQLAREQPKAFLELVVPRGQSATDMFTPPTSQQQSFRPTTTEKNWKYFEDLRKKDSTKYFSVAVQNEIHQNALRLGEKFYD